MLISAAPDTTAPMPSIDQNDATSAPVLEKRIEKFGCIQITVEKSDANSYRIEWLNLMTNIRTRMEKLNPQSFRIENKAPKTPAAVYEQGSLQDAVLTFFINTDITRLSETLLAKSRRWVADRVKVIEKKRTLNIKISTADTFRQHERALNLPVFIGNRKEQQGIMIGLNWSGSRAKVVLLDSKDNPTRVIELNTDLVWIP